MGSRTNKMQAEKIIGVKLVGTKPTLDIEVDHPEHVFYANGIATSNSHSVSYAQEAYLSAYLKAHHTLSFFRSFLNYTYEEPDAFEKISELVDDSKLFNIYVRTPDIRQGNTEFVEVPDKQLVIAGLRCVRGVGESAILKIESLLKSREVASLSVNDWLFEIWPHLSSDTCTNLISVGAFDYLKLDRKRLLFLYQNVLKLTDKEMQWAIDNKNRFNDTLSLLSELSKTKKNGGGTHSVKREQKVLEIIENIKSPPFSLEDDINWIVRTEKHLLGFSSSSRISVVDDYKATSSCLDLVNSRVQNACIAVEIRDVRERIIKNGDNKGKKMASIVMQDESCVIDNAVIFSEKYEEFHSLLEPANCVRMTVYKPKGKDSIIINHVEQL